MLEFIFGMSDDTQKHLVKIGRKIDDTKAVLEVAAEYMIRSTDKNFRAQGRPAKWAPLTQMTRALRRNKKKSTIKILNDTGRLKSSIAKKVYKNHAVVGTNVEYARLHQDGGMSKSGVIQIKAHKRRITQIFGKPITPRTVKVKAYNLTTGSHRVPQRKFLLFQKQDIIAINRFFVKHVEKAIK